MIEPAKELEPFFGRRLGFLLGWHFAIVDLVSDRFPEPQRLLGKRCIKVIDANPRFAVVLIVATGAVSTDPRANTFFERIAKLFRGLIKPRRLGQNGCESQAPKCQACGSYVPSGFS